MKGFYRSIQLSFYASLTLITGYALRSNGVPAWIMLLATGIVGFFSFLKRKKSFNILSFFTGILFAVAFYLFFYYVYARGPSFTNAVFIFSFTSLFCFLWIIIEKKEVLSFLPLLAPFFVAWAFVANWEFPSTFSPFLLYGHVEVFKLFFPLSAAIIILLSERDKIVIEHSFFTGFLLTAALGLREKGIQSLDRYQFIVILLFFAIFSVLFISTLAKRRDEENSVVSSVFGLTLIPAIISGLSLLQGYFGVYLPLPFDREGTLGAIALLSLSGIALLSLFYQGAQENLNDGLIILVPVLAVSLALLFIPFEKNIFIYEGYKKSFFSSGWQFMGPYILAWLTSVFFVLKTKKSFLLAAIYIILSAFSINYLWNERLFHFFSNVPLDLFRELGSPDASWQRIPIFKQMNLVFIFLTVLVLLAEFFRNIMRDEAGEKSASWERKES